MVVTKTHKIAIMLIPALVFAFLVCSSAAADSFTTWNSMTSGSSKDLQSIWGASSSQVFAVGKSGTILQYDGSKWSPMSSGNTSDIRGVWGTDGSDVFVVGGSGMIAHYDGSKWSPMSSGNTSDLQCVWGTSRTDVFAAGNSGIILHYDGSKWSPMSSGTSSDLQCIWGASRTDVFAVGKSGTILHYDGSRWSSMSSGTQGDLYGIWGAAGTDVFVVGESGMIAHYDGSKWSPMNRNTISELRAVWGFSSSDVFAVGWSGAVLRYLPPVIKSISIDRGDQGARLDITITGTNLSGASEVSFGTGIAVNGFTVLSPSQITANITIVVGAEIGARDVSVTTAGGSFVLPDRFTVRQALPTITSVSPGQDRQAAALNVTVTGTNLSGASEVRLGAGIAVNSFTVLSASQISVKITIAADAAPGPRDVSVAAQGGSFTLPGGFTVRQALPTIASINPAQGNQETTFNVTVTGTYLTGASEVRLGTGIVVNSFTVLSPSQITANISLAAGAEIGARDVSVTTPGGSFALPNSFTVKQALPTITSISPDNGSQGATIIVTIRGTNLTGTSEVRFGSGTAVNSFTVPSPSQITVNITIVAGSAIGASDVSVTTPGGSFALPNSFTVKQGLPTITSISPNEGSQGATLDVIISGSNFDGATSVSFGAGVAIKSFTNLSPTQLRVNVMIDEDSATGVRDVSVTTPGGSSTLGNSFNIKERSLGTLIVALIWV